VANQGNMRASGLVLNALDVGEYRALILQLGLVAEAFSAAIISGPSRLATSSTNPHPMSACENEN
jgi:hypothetical protein